jgi:hypothetical protein
MAKATVKVEGLKELKKRLDRISDDMVIKIKNQVQDSGEQIMLDAVRNAPNELLIMGQKSTPDRIDVAQRITNVPKNNGFASEVGIQGNNNIPIYVEFGTGTDAQSYVPTLPKEIQAAARRFYVNGKGRIKKQPYLIPAFLKESPIFISELKKILKSNV